MTTLDAGATPLEYRLSKRQDISFDKIGQLFPVSLIFRQKPILTKPTIANFRFVTE
ncbi:MAG: hypothetical protein NUV84_00460 [Candidatus Uhrbacteria bacterium]|nr:hypothetical protein [Candidatus Uhrbacteria bacterium]